MPPESGFRSGDRKQEPDGRRHDRWARWNTWRPEQVEGKETDTRTDIFAIGVVIYEMATGRKAFEGESKASLTAAILTSEPPPITKAQPMTPPALERVVKRCLAKDPEERWQTARDLASELKWIAEARTTAGVEATGLKPRVRGRGT